jgi:hypothetical protein
LPPAEKLPECGNKSPQVHKAFFPPYSVVDEHALRLYHPTDPIDLGALKQRRLKLRESAGG